MALNIYRSILNELRLINPKGNLHVKSPVFKYISMQFKKYKTTDETLCKARDEMKFLGVTYLTYLQSLRKQSEIHQHFHGKGERTIEATAKLVGFKLPHDPK